MGEVAPDAAAKELTSTLWQRGLALFPNLTIGPHGDALDSYVPGLRAFIVDSVPQQGRLLAIDERTAIIGDGASWCVVGSGSVFFLENGTWERFRSGETFRRQLMPL